jgi:integrase
MVAKKINGKRVYAKLDGHDILKDGQQYVDIRVTWEGWSDKLKKSVYKNVDIGTYTESGIRIKTRKEYFSNGQISRGYNDDEKNSLNNRLDRLSALIVEYIEKGGELTKGKIEHHIYGNAFIAANKMKRTFKFMLPEVQLVPSQELKVLWKTYPNQKIQKEVITKFIDNDGFENIKKSTIEEIVNQISLDDFPNKIPPELYQKYLSDFLHGWKIPEITPDLDPFIKKQLKIYIQDQLYEERLVQTHEISNEELKVYKKDPNVINNIKVLQENKIDIEKMLDDIRNIPANSPDRMEAIFKIMTRTYGQSTVTDSIVQKLDKTLIQIKNNLETEKQEQLINTLDPGSRYAEGFKYKNGKYEIDERYFNPKNIFHLFGLCRFGKKYNEAKDELEPISNYDYIFKNLLDYKINQKPSEDIADLNTQWVVRFLKYLKNDGYIKDNHKLTSNLFKLTESEYQGRERKLYGSVNSFDKITKAVKDYVSELYQLQLITHDFAKTIKSGDLHDFHNSTEYEAKYFILPDEFVKVYNADEIIKRLSKEILLKTLDIKTTELSKKKNELYYYRLSIKDLDNIDRIKNKLRQTKDLFVCQTLLGAMRISDFNDESKTQLRTNGSHLFVKFNQQKTGGRVSNPILKPVIEICKNYGGNLPPRLSEADYNKFLKLLFRILGLSRTFIDEKPSLKGSYNIIEKPLHEAITNKFARATFVVLMTAFGIPDKMIMKWTGHENLAIFLTHYQSILTDERLRLGEEVLNKLLGKGYKNELENIA